MSSDVLMIESVERAAAVLKPLRVEMLREMAEPTTCTVLAELLGQTPQKIYYHVKTMEKAGFVERVDERSVNGIVEGIYQARARSFWLSPKLVNALGGRQAVRDQTSLGILAGHTEEVLEDVGQLARRSAAGEEIPSLSLSVDIELPHADRREEFMKDLQKTFEMLARRYTSEKFDARAARETYRFKLLCYPTSAKEAS